jgi:hypothetical protein
VTTLEEAATRGALARTQAGTAFGSARVPRPVGGGQRYIRGLYSGGTFCYEASLLLGGMLTKTGGRACGRMRRQQGRYADRYLAQSKAHIVDLGDDVFTRGRPHPMIDHRRATNGCSSKQPTPRWR